MKLDRVNIYTSYLSKMSERLKTDYDIYIQVSRSVFCPKVSKSGVKVTEEIDLNFGRVLGNYSASLKEYYENQLTKEEVQETIIDTIQQAEILCKEMNEEDKTETKANIFLLCHENLESKYKATSKAVKEGFAKEGEWQICHRRVLADFIKNNFGLFIPEYDIKPENESVVYRQYF